MVTTRLETWGGVVSHPSKLYSGEFESKPEATMEERLRGSC